MSGKEGDIARDRNGRRDRLLKEHVHDPYMAAGHPPEPTLCTECRAVFRRGRWQWLSEEPEGAHEELCPACQRIHDKVPAGFLTLSGAFYDGHRDEILKIVHNKAEEETAQHPMKRVMGVDIKQDSTVITFTDMHLPRGVGEAIESAYDGDLDIHYTEEAGIVRVYWQR